MTVPVLICEKCGHGMRSYPQLKRFMKLIAVAFEHWPEDHYFQPVCKEHLRAWLIVKSGFKTAQTIRLRVYYDHASRDDLEFMLHASMRAAGAWAITDMFGDHVIVQRPASMSYKTPHAVATQICQAVDEVIFAELGVTSETLLREAEKAA